MHACIAGNLSAVQFIIGFSSFNKNDIDERINKKDTNGCSGFALACSTGQVDIVELLMNHEQCNIFEMNDH